MKKSLKSFTFFCAAMEDVSILDCNNLPKEYEKGEDTRIIVITCKAKTEKEAYKRFIKFAEWHDKIFFTFEDHLSVMVEGYVDNTKGGWCWTLEEEGF